jgi:hypothetical protein
MERFTAAADAAVASGPRLFAFAVDADDATIVESAVEAAASEFSGPNRRGRALVAMAHAYHLAKQGEKAYG